MNAMAIQFPDSINASRLEKHAFAHILTQRSEEGD